MKSMNAEKSFMQIFNTYADDVFRHSISTGLGRESSLEVTRETFERVWRLAAKKGRVEYRTIFEALEDVLNSQKELVHMHFGKLVRSS